MRGQQIAIIPGILIGSLILFGLAEIVFSRQISAEAKNFATEEPRLSIVEKEAPQCNLGSDYPASILQWCFAIEQASRRVGMDSNIIAAVMLQESGGDPSAISSSGAVGLLQVMPRDGKASEFMCVNGPCFASRPLTEQLLDPTFNLRYGANLLAELVNQTGDLREALMRYGPYNVGYYYADKVLAIIELYAK